MEIISRMDSGNFSRLRSIPDPTYNYVNNIENSLGHSLKGLNFVRFGQVLNSNYTGSINRGTITDNFIPCIRPNTTLLSDLQSHVFAVQDIIENGVSLDFCEAIEYSMNFDENGLVSAFRMRLISPERGAFTYYNSHPDGIGSYAFSFVQVVTPQLRNSGTHRHSAFPIYVIHGGPTGEMMNKYFTIVGCDNLVDEGVTQESNDNCCVTIAVYGFNRETYGTGGSIVTNYPFFSFMGATDSQNILPITEVPQNGSEVVCSLPEKEGGEGLTSVTYLSMPVTGYYYPISMVSKPRFSDFTDGDVVTTNFVDWRLLTIGVGLFNDVEGVLTYSSFEDYVAVSGLENEINSATGEIYIQLSNRMI